MAAFHIAFLPSVEAVPVGHHQADPYGKGGLVAYLVGIGNTEPRELGTQFLYRRA
jgi:hypothetical protein